jgi:hypothetical protein
MRRPGGDAAVGGLFAYRQTSYVHAQTLAVLIVAALTAISLTAPPRAATAALRATSLC